MRFKLETKEGTTSILAGIAGLLGFQLFYFGLALPPSKISQPLVFSAFYLGWALLGFVMAVPALKDKRRGQDAFLVFAILLAIALGIGVTNPYLAPIPSSFPGFATGIAALAIVVLLRRSIRTLGHLVTKT